MLTAYIDGGSRGNPGPAGYGVRFVQEDGTVVRELRASIGTATNNVAEYQGLIAALRYAAGAGHRALRIRSDSLLLVRQMLGQYRVKNAGLQPLHRLAQVLAAGFDRLEFEHVPRAQNAEADRLANEAMDETAG